MTDLKRTEQQSKPDLTEGTGKFLAVPDLTMVEALALAKTNAPELAARLRGDRPRAEKALVRNGPSLWPSKHVRKVRALRWRWWLTDPDSINSISDGYALTETWAWHRAGQAAARVFNERAEAAKAALPKPKPHPFFARCKHGVQFLNECDDCPNGCPAPDAGTES